VKSDQPEAWKQIPILPVLDVRSVPEHGLLVLAAFTRLAAYDRRGLVWKSPRLCRDELKIINVTHHTIEGVGYDPTNVGESRFAVDIVYHKMEIDFRLVLRYFAPPTYAQNLASSLQVRQSLADDYFVLLPLSAATRAAES
jgi:hypothetical protein